jgi:hydrogenase maturation protease
MRSVQTEVLVVGLGNILLEDDGLGVRAVEALGRDFATPADVRIVDGGTLGLALLGDVAAARRVVLVDAVASDDPPGTLVRLTGDDVEPAVRGRLSPHQIGVADLLDALRLIDHMPESVSMLGLTPATIELGTELSPAVEDALPALVAAITSELAILGRPLVSRTPEGAAATPSSAPTACAAERMVNTIRGAAPPSPVPPPPDRGEWTCG